MTNKNDTYNKAQKELEKILSDLEKEDDINLDFISTKVKRAAELLDICKKQLHDIDKELETILSKLD